MKIGTQKCFAFRAFLQKNILWINNILLTIKDITDSCKLLKGKILFYFVVYCSFFHIVSKRRKIYNKWG